MIAESGRTSRKKIDVLFGRPLGDFQVLGIMSAQLEMAFLP
jgi:hypothetical protein